MGKLEYWHLVVEIGKEAPKNVHIGNCMTHPYKHDGYWVLLMNMTNGHESSDTYKLVYLGRLPKEMPFEERREELRRWIIEKGFQNIVPWVKKETQLT